MFREATVWDLRLGKIASVVFSGLFVFLLISNLKNFGRDDWWHLTIDYSTYVSGFIFYSVIVSSWLFFKNPQREAKYYPFALLISILLLNWLFFINFHLMTPPITEVTDPRYFETLGRRLYYIFVPMPLILMFALLHLRVWAVILFLLLAISPQLLKLFWVINHPRTFYASNLQDLNNAAALDAGFIWFNAVVCIVALCAMFGLLFFNNYALKTAQRIERTNTLLGRYFAPEVRQEIETFPQPPDDQFRHGLLRPDPRGQFYFLRRALDQRRVVVPGQLSTPARFYCCRDFLILQRDDHHRTPLALYFFARH